MQAFAYVIFEMLKVTPEQIRAAGIHGENVANIELKDFYALFVALSKEEKWKGKTYHQMFCDSNKKKIMEHGWKLSSFDKYKTPSFLPWWQYCCLAKGLSTCMLRRKI